MPISAHAGLIMLLREVLNGTGDAPRSGAPGTCITGTMSGDWCLPGRGRHRRIGLRCNRFVSTRAREILLPNLAGRVGLGRPVAVGGTLARYCSAALVHWSTALLRCSHHMLQMNGRQKRTRVQGEIRRKVRPAFVSWWRFCLQSALAGGAFHPRPPERPTAFQGRLERVGLQTHHDIHQGRLESL